ncbi:MAG TPA: glycosyltransferase [Phycisphaerae bacterium]|nr:glycosyltransferase [Phycisphaerae bacterium]
MAEEKSEPVHVLHVMPGLGPGGIELALSRVVRGLSGPHMQHSVVCLKGEPVIRDCFDPCVRVYAMHAGANELNLPVRLRRLIRQIRPDVIHARNWSAWPDVTLARLLVSPRVPLIFSFHGVDSPGRVPRRRAWAMRILTSLTDCVFAVSGGARDFLVHEIGLPATRVAVIPNGVDTERYAPGPPRAATGRLVVGTVGSLTAVKNHLLLIRACAMLVREGLDLELRIAGDGPERSRLTEAAHSLDVADRVRLLGHVRDVPGFLRGLDVFVLPSLSEAHPNALLEAMACGLPCVGMRVGGVPEVLGNGRFGILVVPSDVRELAHRIRQLAENLSLRDSLGRAARQQVVEHCSMESMLAAYEVLYRSPRTAEATFRPSCERADRLDRRPRVVMLGPLPPATGGMATVLGNLHRSRLAVGCRLHVLDNGKTTPERRPLSEGILAQVRLLGRLARAIVTHDVQIVHIHTCSGFTFWRDCLHLAVAKMLRRKVVLHVHGGRFDEFGDRLSSPGRAALRLALHAADAVIALSASWVARLRRYAPAARWRVVPNGVPIPPLRDHRSHPRLTFLFMGDLSQQKGAPDLVAAAGKAFRKGLQGTILIAGGEGLPGDKERMDRLVVEGGLASHIRLLGVVSGACKESALAEADCLVLPSYAEGLPMAILEGMAYGLPIIATRVGAIPEAITDGVEGFLVEPGDIESLADRLRRLSMDAELREQMGIAARRRVEAGHSLDVMVEGLLTVYREALGRRGRPWS